MFNPLISIIIPIFNTEKYLQKCLDSIFCQSCTDFEIICIDDGSTDNSVGLIQEYIQKHKNIKLITQKNKGPAGARNVGLNLARGKYAWFVDSDDWVEPNSIEILKRQIEIFNSDFIAFKANTFNNSTNKFETNYNYFDSLPNEFYNKVISLKDAYDFIFQLPVEVWCRIYSIDFIRKNKLNFNEGIWGKDDGVFTTEFLLSSKKIVYLDKLLYHYRIKNPKSIMYSFKETDLKNYNVSLLYAIESDKMIKKYNVDSNLTINLTLRNLDRIVLALATTKGAFKRKVYNAIRSYLNSCPNYIFEHTKINGYNKFLNYIKNTPYIEYVIKSFFYENIRSSTNIKLSIFKVPFFKKNVQHGITKKRSIFSLYKSVVIKTPKNIISTYYFLNIPIHRSQTKTMTSPLCN